MITHDGPYYLEANSATQYHGTLHQNTLTHFLAITASQFRQWAEASWKALKKYFVAKFATNLTTLVLGQVKHAESNGGDGHAGTYLFIGEKCI